VTEGLRGGLAPEDDVGLGVESRGVDIHPRDEHAVEQRRVEARIDVGLDRGFRPGAGEVGLDRSGAFDRVNGRVGHQS
jgi:hypothetical protein